MIVGVVYKFQKHNKLNGSVFYCFEYFCFLKKYLQCNFYVVGATDKDILLLKNIFGHKYNLADNELDSIIPLKTTDLHKLNLDKTLILDIKTFYSIKAFLTNEVFCFSNEKHDLFRYTDDRVVKYFGSYQYQDYDEYCLLKLNFDIFKQYDEQENGVFLSCPDYHILEENKEKYRERFVGKKIIEKKHFGGFGDLFRMVDTVLYIHTRIDTNNRIIPEAFYYDCDVVIDDHCDVEDSVKLRFNDITDGGLFNYTLGIDDVMIQALMR